MFLYTRLPGSGTGYLDLPCTAVPLWSQMTDVKSCRELEMLHGAEKCGCTHLHVKWPGRRGSSHIVRGTAPTCCLILHSPTVHQRIMHISHGGKWICTERLAYTVLIGFGPVTRLVAKPQSYWNHSTETHCWTRGKLATSRKMFYGLVHSNKFFSGDVSFSFCATWTSVINVHSWK